MPPSKSSQLAINQDCSVQVDQTGREKESTVGGVLLCLRVASLQGRGELTLAGCNEAGLRCALYHVPSCVFTCPCCQCSRLCLTQSDWRLLAAADLTAQAVPGSLLPGAVCLLSLLTAVAEERWLPGDVPLDREAFHASILHCCRSCRVYRGSVTVTKWCVIQLLWLLFSEVIPFSTTRRKSRWRKVIILSMGKTKKFMCPAGTYFSACCASAC